MRPSTPTKQTEFWRLGGTFLRTVNPTMKISSLALLCLLIAAAPVAGQQQFEPTPASRRQAIASGRAKEYVAAMEALAPAAAAQGRWDTASRAYTQAASASIQLGQLQKALALAMKASEMAEKGNDAYLQALATLTLADTYGRLGQPQKEREWLDKTAKATQLVKGENKDIMEARLNQQSGENYLRQGNAPAAIERLSNAATQWESRLALLRSPLRANNKDLQADIHFAVEQLVLCLHRLGTAYLRARNLKEAKNALERGIAILATAELQSSMESSLYMSLGEAYVVEKDFPRAVETLTKGLQLAEARGQTSQLQRTSGAIGNILLQSNRPAEAIPFYKKAVDTVESTRSLLESEELRTSFFESKGRVYAGIILSQLGAKNLEEAFNYNERARSRAFLDVLGSKVQLGRQSALVEEEKRLQSKLAELLWRSAAGRSGDEESVAAYNPALRKELDSAEKAYSNFLAKVRKENREQASLMNVEPLTLKQVQGLLDPGVTMLEYFVFGSGRAALWVVTKEQVNFVRLSLNRDELISKVSALREIINQQEQEKFKQASLELYRALIGPALRHIKGKELLIIPHDVLHYLPFQALVSPGDRYLIQDYSLHFLSSASLMQFTREKKRPSRETALAMGNPALGDEAYNLRFAEREAKELAQIYPNGAVYMKAHATKTRMLSLSPQHDILHFAVHAEFNQEDPMNSALLLARAGNDDGKLKVGDIFSLNLKADLVVLSACETGLGKISDGDEIIGLTRAFIYAGTPSVITTLWKVNDRASYELMREFYVNLKTMTKSEALRQAQLKTMKEFPQPFFWAAYTLTGEP